MPVPSASACTTCAKPYLSAEAITPNTISVRHSFQKPSTCWPIHRRAQPPYPKNWAFPIRPGFRAFSNVRPALPQVPSADSSAAADSRNKSCRVSNAISTYRPMIKAVIQETLSSKAGHRLSAGSIRALQPGRACQEGTHAPRDRKEAVLARQVGRAAQPSDHHCHPALQDCGRRGRLQTCRRPPRRLREKRSRSAVGCPPLRGPSATASSPCWSMPLQLPTGRG